MRRSGSTAAPGAACPRARQSPGARSPGEGGGFSTGRRLGAPRHYRQGWGESRRPSPGGAQRPALPGPGCSSQLQYPPKRLVPNPSPPSPTSAQPGSAPGQDEARPSCSANTVTTARRMPFNREINENKDSRLCQASVLPIENALHISSPATFPHSTQRKSHSQLHLTVEETEAQGHALLNGEHPFPGSFQNKDSSCHLLSTGLTGNLTVIAGYQKKCMSYPGFSPAKLAR